MALWPHAESLTGSEARTNNRRDSPGRSICAIAITFIITFSLLFKPWVYGIDPVGYFSWLRSVAIDRDLDVSNELVHYGIGDLWDKTPTQHTHNKYAIGSAMLWAPAYFTVHRISQIANLLGVPVPVDGYAPQYIWAVSLSSVGYGLGAVLITYYLCRKHFTEAVSAIATIAAWLSGPLLFYMYSSPTMSHANDAFVFAVFILAWYSFHGKRTAKYDVVIGATAALCALVRQQNAIFVIPCIVEMLSSELRNDAKHPHTTSIRQAVIRIAAFSFGWWLTFAPQLLVWRIVFGEWINSNPYGGGFDWHRPQIISLLISNDHGLLLWNPYVLPAAIGWASLWRRDRRLAGMLVAVFLLQLYTVAAWRAWNAGGAGQRFFTNLMPAFSLGLAGLLTRVRDSSMRSLSPITIIGVIFWNAMIIVRYVLEDFPRIGGSVSYVDFVVGQFTVVPRYLGRIVEILATRQ